MTTVIIDKPERAEYELAIKNILETRIRKTGELVVAQAMEEVKKSIEEHVAQLVVKIFHTMSFERAGTELRISVSLPKSEDKKS